MTPNDLLLVSSLTFTFICVCGLFYEFYKDFRLKSNIDSRKIIQSNKSNVPYTRLINEVVKYTAPHLLSHAIKKYPKVKVIYRKHRSVRGRYRSGKKTIELYVHPKIKVNQLVKTTLHEIKHYIQHRTDPNFTYYDLYNQKYGYEKNEFEIDAREFANNQLEPCLSYLRVNKFIP
jgi:hypothetical protein